MLLMISPSFGFSSISLTTSRSHMGAKVQSITALQARGNSNSARERGTGSRKNRRAEQLDSMYAPSERLEQPGPFQDHPALPMVYDMVKAADARKAVDIRVVHVEGITPSNSFMVICSGNSRPQNQAIATFMEDEVEEVHERKPISRQGTAESGWILLDYGDVVAHVMTPKSRAYYDLEGFWKNGQEVDIEHLIVPNSGAQSSDEDADDFKSFKEIDDDPFWS